jgi:replicative DNA helicase
MASTKSALPATAGQTAPAQGVGAAPLGKPAAAGRQPRAATLATLTLERALPNSADAEMAVLGAMLLSPAEVCPLAQDRLSQEHFYHAPHQILFRELIELQDTLQTVDQVTLQQRLKDRNLLDAVGGPAYLSELIMRVPTAAHVEHYMDIVSQKYLLRQLIVAGADIVARSFDEQDSVNEWVDQVQQTIFQITAERASQGARAVKDLIVDAMASIDQLHARRGMTGIPTGFRDLDKLTSGLNDANMIVIAGRPSTGKTALALNIAENIALDQKLPVGVFSLEMSAQELVKRMLCSRAKVNLRAVADGFLSERDFHPLTTVASQLMKAPLYIDDSANLSIHQLRARARRMKSQFDIRLIVVDYLQLMRAPSRRADMSRQTEISDISLGIKALAKELQIPVIVLSQLNRQPEQREGGRPRLADLRESGAIEQDADVVGLLTRPEMYADDEGEKAAERGKATLIIAKQRNGPVGNVELTFLNEFTRFEDAALISDEDIPTAERNIE